ncbi:ATP-binding protein [Nocardia sp. NBC_01503]|uniref:ATP-binding protein n=1 Tax=Nocardia sp. NBC_01503 TaxID=2975997 RepID=UPI002E7B1598|nr:ATP-binding protein [Nocardia sp. NBC_01503]WTL29247.1 ATP-binding protein [Nocardia sp. NBC_01503]
MRRTAHAACDTTAVTSSFSSSPIGRILPRHAHSAVHEALADTRVVLVNGARQCGKSTLVARIGREIGATWRSLDKPETRQAAGYDPTQFVLDDSLLIIDEVQRVPELLLAIKETVDADGRPGRFLLTGSAHVMALRSVPDALPGRMETIELWPLSQGEIDGAPDRFIDSAFERGPQLRHDGTENRDDYIERIARGGFPEAVAREGKRRSRFFSSYVADLINRDVMQLSEIERSAEMFTLANLVAARSGQLLVPGALGNELGLPKDTVARYLRLLEEVFLIKRIPAWSRNLTTRAVATSKVFMVDSGIATYLCGADSRALRAVNGPLGSLLEGFVAAELARQLTWSDQEARMFHYRTRDNVEVDIILENNRREVIAIEVKAATTVKGEDFRGLRHLAERLGDDLLAGYLLYTGTETLPFGPKFRALPISALWNARP